MCREPTPVRVTLAAIVRAMREHGFTLPPIREYLTEVLERAPQLDWPGGWPKVWRLVFDAAGHFSMITPEGEINVDGVAITTLPVGARRPGPIAPLSEAEEIELAITMATDVLKVESEN